MPKFIDKHKGDKFTTTDYNNIAREVKKLITIKGACGVTVQNTAAGIVVKGDENRQSFYYVKCTGEDTPSAGLHTFKECDYEGIVLTGTAERTFKNCKLIGDFTKSWDIAVLDTNNITALDSATKKITVSGNHSDEYAADNKITITGSTDNDGTYTVVSSTWNDPNTDIVVSEAIDDSTVDGALNNATSASFGMLFIKKTKDGYSNQVLLLPYPGNAYYYE